MVTLAGIGFTYLGMAQLFICFQAGYSGLLTFAVMLLVFFGGFKTDPVPASVAILAVGFVGGWLSFQRWEGGGSIEAVSQSFGAVGFYIPSLLDAESLSVVPEVLGENLAMILPVSFTGALGTLLCVYGAAEAGDVYSIRETMIVDGATTMLAAIFGSPLGTCVYIGHPQYKSQHGGVYYSVLSGLMFSALSITGMFAALSAFLPPYATAPMILFVGLAINQDTFSICPPRHIPAAIVGVFPAVADWILSFWPSGQVHPPPALYALGKGALLTGLIWTSVTVFVIDQRFKEAAIWTAVGAFLAGLGLIHQASMDLTFERFLCGGPPPADGAEAGSSCNDFGTSACSFVLGYLQVSLLMVGMWWLQGSASDRVASADREDDAHKAETMIQTMSTVVAKWKSFTRRQSLTAATPLRQRQLSSELELNGRQSASRTTSST
ncbi:unnamed protein product [Prorocentrum cordatum]|uniref:H(+)-exporting diphosphatase n=1 Tax=Prorocentrum cordatum TaxID=2364126 RepID=A0ABN9YBN7_9DINO|nr:unnamed protein product [Polarella glacialis]